eukprot:TCONS_00023687-protein
MDEYEDFSREEIIHFCERLQKKLKKYEKKLSDLVSAYKDLAEEKKLLEDSLKAVKQERRDKDDKTFLQKSKDFITKSKQPVVPPQPPENNDAESGESAEKKLNVVTKAFQTLTEKKSKMEASFQADKKNLVVEHNKTVTKFEDDVAMLTIQLERLKNKLGQEQKDRENDAQLHSNMLVELQNVLATERLMNDELKSQIAQLTSKKEHVKSRTPTPEVPRKDLKPTIKQRQQLDTSNGEIEKIKKDLIEEQERISKAEVLFQLRQTQDEERIRELEQKVSELSDSIGHYEKQRYNDQSTIHKLKHKLENLEEASSPTAHTTTLSFEAFDDRNGGSGGGVKEKIRLSSSEEYMRYFDSEKMYSPTADCSNHEMCNCKQELRKLKLELDNYKSKYLQQQKKDNHTVNSQVAEEYQSQITALKQEKKLLIRNYQEKEKNYLDAVHKLEKGRISADEKYKSEACEVQKAHSKQVGDLQMELQKQRIRSMNLLSEKDMEIEKLHKNIYDGLPGSSSSTAAILPTVHHHHYNTENALSEEFEDFLITPPTKKEEGSLFHFMEQNSFERDLSKLRHQVIDLEETSRESEQREARLLQQMEVLKEEIRKQERSKSRESANLEYLKNICLRYMLTKSISQRKQMSITLSTILKFSPNEMKDVEKRHAAGWW